MMNRVEFADGSEWACNSAHEGIFKRQRDGSYSQLMGTMQTPIFRTTRQFVRYIAAFRDQPRARMTSRRFFEEIE